MSLADTDILMPPSPDEIDWSGPLRREDPLARGLAGYWSTQLGRGTGLADLATSRPAAILGGAAWTGAGPLGGGALDFSAIGARVVTGLARGSSQVSIAAWYLDRGVTGETANRIISKQNATVIEYNIEHDGASNQFDFWVTCTGVDGYWRWGNLALNAWHHMVLTYDFTAIAQPPRVYIDGVARVVTTLATPTGAAQAAPDKPAVLGCRSDTNSQSWNGKLADAAVWHRVLGADEAARLFRPESRWDLYRRLARRRLARVTPTVELACVMEVTATLTAALAISAPRSIHKHVDFEVPGWGEFASPPGETGGGAALTQTGAAAFPDRPGLSGSMGMRLALATGAGEARLVLPGPPAGPVTHVRMAIRVAESFQGRVGVVRAVRADTSVAWGLEVSREEGAGVLVHWRDGAGHMIEAGWPSGSGWHIIEAGVDADAGTATLWIDGRPRGAAVTGHAADIAQVHLGALDKDVAAAGIIDLDEFVLADAHIGVVRVPPSGSYADDPARWLVLHRRDQPSSVAWAGHYRAARGVPHANLLGLDTPAAEVIDAAGLADLRGQVADHLATHLLDGQILGILIAPGVPGYVEQGGALLPLSVFLHDLAGAAADNPLVGDLSARPDAARLAGLRLVSRIDAPTSGQATALVDRAGELLASGLGDGSRAALRIDPRLGDSGPEQAAAAEMTAWAGSVQRQLTRLPWVVAQAPAGPGPAPSLHDDGFHWGASGSPVPEGYFGVDPLAKRAVCFHAHHLAATAGSLRTGGTGNWALAALQAGYAAAIGSSAAYDAADLPRPGPFFEALRQGWTLAEAWIASTPNLGSPLFLVGDPLLRVAFPASGWDLLGPAARWEEIEGLATAGAAREAERSIQAASPTEGSTGVLVLRHVDARGRGEAGVAVQVMTQGGAAMTPVAPPLWPREAGWEALSGAEGALLRLLQDQPFHAQGITRVALESSDGGPGATEIWTARPAPRERAMSHLDADPVSGRCYRWVQWRGDGAVWRSPWSRPLVLPSGAATTLEWA